MGRIKVGCVLNRMFVSSATVLRSAQGAFIGGIWQRGEDLSLSIRASVQPLGEEDFAALPQGVKDRENRVIYSRTELKGSVAGVEADIVIYAGSRWRIVRAKQWGDYGYFECIMTKEVATA